MTPITKVLGVILKLLNCFPSDGELFGTPCLGQNRRPKQCWPVVNGRQPGSPGLQFLGLRVSISAGPPGQKIPKNRMGRAVWILQRRGLCSLLSLLRTAPEAWTQDCCHQRWLSGRASASMCSWLLQEMRTVGQVGNITQLESSVHGKLCVHKICKAGGHRLARLCA